MTQYNPFIKLNQLIIFTHNGKIAYNETFHEGINIIRGNNGSGKSTISNFIFYVLGGDFNKWTTYALKCTDIFAEIEINGTILTLKRIVSEKSMQPMYIFWGSYLDSKKSGSEHWEIFPYKRSDYKKSFSNALFLALGFPELRGDVDSNITMHQILRLIYIDQKSSTQDLMLTDNFDSSITRTTVADLLFGVYDDTLYSDKLELREKEKEYEIYKKQFDGVESIYKSTGAETNIEIIDALIKNNIEELNKIESYLTSNDIDDKNVKFEEDTQQSLKKLKELLINEKRDYTNYLEEIEYYEYEVLDSHDFINSLIKRSLSINESLVTKELLGEIELIHCPNCLNVLKSTDNEHDCKLCKQTLPEDKIKSHHKKMQQELDNQIRESKMLLKDKELKLQELKSIIPSVANSIKTTQNKIENIVNKFQTKRNKDYDYLLVKKGELISKNNFLIQQQKAISQIDVLRKELIRLTSRISELKISVNSKENDKRNKLLNAKTFIQQTTLNILKSDLGRQKEFLVAKKVDLDFSKNTFSLDGQNNFSESSNVYLKNSIRFAIFFGSLQFNFFRFPRFILCDNIEDKGMQPDRSKSFQRKIVQLSSLSRVKHQIIFATSMIDEELNKTDLCVGEFYDENNKTLKHLDD